MASHGNKTKSSGVLLKRLNETAKHGKGVNGEDAEGEGMSTRATAMNETFVRAREEKIDGNSTTESSVTTKKRKLEDGDDPDSGRRRERRNVQNLVLTTLFRPLLSLHRYSLHQIQNRTLNRYPSHVRWRKLRSHTDLSFSSCFSGHDSHRARIRAAKRIADKSASAIAEILGIAPSTSVSTSESTPAPTLLSSSTPTPQPSLSLDNLTTSTKSVADYFKEKLIARSSSSSS